jgi:hypothetical protein
LITGSYSTAFFNLWLVFGAGPDHGRFLRAKLKLVGSGTARGENSNANLRKGEKTQ